MKTSGVSRRNGMEYIPFMEADPDPDRVIVSMVEHKGRLYCATQKGIYILKDGEFSHVKMEEYKGEVNEVHDR
ncbi:hypothetical protein LCGC14_1374030 [marine sediment metagenome]|uniref:Glucose/Sorbosone dehydrogenase domain-containing protein n=1 Tax=marine sediment metagenome TaxID=412755 RepID=A0A0F9MJR1_9ZZZZ